MNQYIVWKLTTYTKMQHLFSNIYSFITVIQDGTFFIYSVERPYNEQNKYIQATFIIMVFLEAECRISISLFKSPVQNLKLLIYWKLQWYLNYIRDGNNLWESVVTSFLCMIKGICSFRYTSVIFVPIALQNNLFNRGKLLLLCILVTFICLNLFDW